MVGWGVIMCNTEEGILRNERTRSRLCNRLFIFPDEFSMLRKLRHFPSAGESLSRAENLII